MIQNYRHLLNDKKRIKAFRRAINTLVNTNNSVAEIGAGLGTYSFFAIQNGASPVYAIEMGDIYYTAQKIAQKNGLESRVNFIHDKSTQVNLPQKVDYLIMEDYRPFFLYKGLENTIKDARNRFLAPDGRFIPNRIILYICPVQSKELWNKVALWERKSKKLYDIDWSYTTKLSFNQLHQTGDSKMKLLGKKSKIKNINLSQDNDFTFKFQTNAKIKQAGIIHGLVGWWDCYFTPEQYFSNSPIGPKNTWGQTFFPIRKPLKVEKNQQIHIGLYTLESQHSGKINYKWWIQNEKKREGHNTFQGSTTPLEKILNQNINNKPKLNQKGKIAKYILQNIGDKSFQQLAQDIQNRYSNYFNSQSEATKFINNYIQKFYST